MDRTPFFVAALSLASIIAPAQAAEPEGYVWPLSVAPGETLTLYVTGTLTPYDPDHPNVTIHRVTAEASGLIVAEAAPSAGLSLPSVDPPAPGPYDYRDGAPWEPSATFTIPGDWPTGYYVATLESATGPAYNYNATFTVKPAADKRHRTAILANVNTWNAYNRWGGRFKYSNAAVTSFMRPDPDASIHVQGGVPFPATHLAHAEVWLYTAIEDYLGRGNVDLYNDIDFHNGAVQAGAHVGQYDRLILSTHPEYWTTQEYDNLRSFLDHGGTVLYLGGNGLFETAAYSTTAGGAAMTFLNGVEGPDGSADNDLRVPALFRVKDAVANVPPRAERALLGIATTACDQPSGGTPYVVEPYPPAGSYARGIFDAVLTGVVEPDDTDRRIGILGLMSGASGHEVDRLAIRDGSGYVSNQPVLTCDFPDILEKDTTPAGVVKLAEGGLIGVERGADMTYYPYPNPPGPNPGGGFVFSVGSINFGQSLLVDDKLRALLDNILCSGRLEANHPLHISRSTAGPRNRGACVSHGSVRLKKDAGVAIAP